MGAVGVLVLLLVCVCTAAEVSITCDEVTGHVGDKLTLTCRVSYEDNTCCTMMYKFMNKDKATTICRENFASVPCIQLTSISCPYTANEVTTTTFKVFIQTNDDPISADFTVNIAEAVKEDDTGGPNREGDPTNETPVQTEDDKSALVIILSVISCLIIIIMGFILKRKCNS